MSRHRFFSATMIWCALAIAAPAFSAGAPDSAALLAAQRQSMQPLGVFDGTWRGPARVRLPNGKELLITQTERVGSFLGETVKVIEGRGYAEDGTSPFNAFAVISYSPQNGKYNFHSYAQGYSGDFPLEVRPDGFTWSIQAGPATLRYTATVKDGVWTEIGERIVEGQAPVKTFEMCIGSLSEAKLRHAGEAVESAIAGPLELLTISGSLSPSGAHLHVAVSDASGRVHGGHAGYGNVIRTTAEVLLALLPDGSLTRELDAATGFNELVVHRRP